MDGFKETFPDLYGGDENQMIGSGGYAVINKTLTNKNNSSSNFCGPPNDFADSENTTRTCGSGNGAGAASKIVSRPILKYYFEVAIILQGFVSSVLSLGAILGSVTTGCKL